MKKGNFGRLRFNPRANKDEEHLARRYFPANSDHGNKNLNFSFFIFLSNNLKGDNVGLIEAKKAILSIL
jgi:hypothetical protein